jgi:transposase
MSQVIWYKKMYLITALRQKMQTKNIPNNGRIIPDSSDDEHCPLLLKDKKNSWAHIFRTEVYPHIPIDLISACYCNDNGRPTKNLYTMASLMLLQDLQKTTISVAVESLRYNVLWQYACNIGLKTDEKVRLCEKTYYTFRKKMRDNGLAQSIFAEITGGMIDKFNVNTALQRLDSTHIKSRMKEGGRLALLTATNLHFLKALRRTNEDAFYNLPDDLSNHYLSNENSGYFADKNTNRNKSATARVIKDMHGLISKFEGIADIVELPEYQTMQRVFSEQCTLEPSSENDPADVTLKEPKEVGCDSVQWPTDPDAGYSAHKGKGYQVQICETFTATDNPDEKGLNLITFFKLEKASEQDADALQPTIKELEARGVKPQELQADTAYGGDDNYVFALENDVNLITPIAGRKLLNELGDDNEKVDLRKGHTA